MSERFTGLKEQLEADLHGPWPVLDKGFVKVVRHNLSDEAAILSAKVSYNNDDLEGVDVQRFLNFLVSQRHGTPFEACQITLQIKAPIFVFREWMRHRIGHSYNEMSGRYTVLPEEWYVPARDDVREQVGRPGQYTYQRVEDDALAENVRCWINMASRAAFSHYKEMLNQGIAKEVARVVLPVNTYSMMHWSTSPRSLMHWLGLRNKPDAQREIRYYAEVVEQRVFAQLMPVTCQAFIDNNRVSP